MSFIETFPFHSEVFVHKQAGEFLQGVWLDPRDLQLRHNMSVLMLVCPCKRVDRCGQRLCDVCIERDGTIYNGKGRKIHRVEGWMWRRIADTARTATQSDIDSTLLETTPVIRVQDSGPFKVNLLFLTLSIEVLSSCS